MYRHLIFITLFLSSTFSFGQSLPPVSITHTLSLTAFQPGRIITETFNFSTTSYHQIRQDAIPIDVLLQLDDVPANIADKLRIGGTQKPESIFDGNNGAKSLVFRQSWVPGTNPLSLTLTNQAAQPNSPPMTIALNEPNGAVMPAPGRRVINPGRRVPAVGAPRPFDDEAYVIDFCPDVKKPIQLPYQKSQKRDEWAFIRKGEQARLVVTNINPLRYSVGVDAATLAFNTDAAAVRGAVDAIIKNGVITAAAAGNSETALRKIIELEFDLNAKLVELRKLDCFTSTDIQNLNSFLQGPSVDGKLTSYPNQVWLDIELKQLAADLEEQAKAAGVKPDEKARLNALAAYAKRDDYAKSIFAMRDQLKAVPDGTILKTDWVEADDYSNVDVIRFTRTSKNLLDSTAPPKVKYYDVWLVGKMKLDFSAGLIVSDLADQTMAVKDEIVTQTVVADGVTKDVKVVRQRPFAEERDKGTLAIATLGHLYWRSAIWKSLLNFGITLGGGISTKGRPVLLGGGSLMIGRQQRLVISAGAAVGTQKELSARYNDTSNYYITDPADAFTYVDRTRIRGFLGLTFSFGQTPKKEVIIGAPAKEEKKE